MFSRRSYSETERAGFASRIADRAPFRPAACHGGANCWVAEGPPAITSRKRAATGSGYTSGIFCRGCGGRPNVPGRWRHWKGPRRS
jgi:hypothetical protein